MSPNVYQSRWHRCGCLRGFPHVCKKGGQTEVTVIRDGKNGHAIGVMLGSKKTLDKWFQKITNLRV